MEKQNIFKAIYLIVKKIPEGKVATYGQIAELTKKQKNLKTEILKKITPRVVGWALHAPRHAQGKPNIPCHRVVDRNGRLAPNFAWDGWKEQRKRLLVENVPFKDKKHVDLKVCLWQSNLKTKRLKD